MAVPTRVRQQTWQTILGATSVSPALTANTVGNGLLLFINVKAGSGTGVTSVTDNIGHTGWRRVGAIGVTSGPATQLQAWWLPVTTGAVTTITVTPSASAIVTCSMWEVSGHDTGAKAIAVTTPTYDATVDTAYSLGTITPPVHECLILAAATANSSSAGYSAVGSPYTLGQTATATATLAGIGTAYVDQTTSAAATASMTASSSLANVALAVAIAPSGAYTGGGIANSRIGYRASATAGWSARSLFKGPTSPDLYAVVLNTSTSKIEVYKSANLGTTWAVQDSTNSRTHSGALHSYDAFIGEGDTTIHVAYRTATNTFRVRTFDMATDTWAGADIGAADASTTASEAYGIALGVRSDGDVLLVYRNSSNADLYYTRYEGSSWAAGATLNGAADGIVQSITMAPSTATAPDAAHVLFYDPAAADTSHISISNANALSAILDLDATSIPNTSPPLSIFGAYVQDGANHRLAFPVWDSTGEFDLAHMAQALAPTLGTLGAITGTTLTDPGNMGGSAVPYGSRWHVIYSADGRGQIHGYSDLSAAGTLTAPSAAALMNTVPFATTATDPPVYATLGHDGIAVIWTDGTTTNVGWYRNATVAPAAGGGDTQIASADTGAVAGTHASTLGAALASADTGVVSAAHASTLAVELTSADSGAMSAAHASALAVVVASSDTAAITGAHGSSVEQTVAVASADSGTITAAHTSTLDAALTGADSGAITGSHASTLAVAVSGADTSAVSGAHASTLEADLAGVDAGTITGGQASTVAVAVASADAVAIAASHTDNLATALASVDSGIVAATHGSSVQMDAVEIASADTGTITATHGSSVAISPQSADAGLVVATHASIVSAELESADTVVIVGTEAPVIAAEVASADAGTIAAAEASALIAAISVADVVALIGSQLSSVDTTADADDLGPISATVTVPTVTAVATTPAITATVVAPPRPAVIVIVARATATVSVPRITSEVGS